MILSSEIPCPRTLSELAEITPPPTSYTLRFTTTLQYHCPTTSPQGILPATGPRTEEHFFQKKLRSYVERTRVVKYEYSSCCQNFILLFFSYQKSD